MKKFDENIITNNTWKEKEDSRTIINIISRSEYDKYLPKLNKDWIEKQERAFNTALAYEKNCIAKYDYIDNKPSRPPKKGERMEDFAFRYGTTMQEMKNQWRQVEKAISL